MRVTVIGCSLGGLAAAARLAKVGHDVTLYEARGALGPWRIDDPLPFPAPWRDLFTKTGRTLDSELRRAGLALVPDPGSVTDRGETWHAMNRTHGTAAADAWRNLVDRLDEVWQVLRPLGLEAELDDPAGTRDRRLRGTLEDLARTLPSPDLAARVRSLASGWGSEPARTPAWLASRLSVERTFGLWLLHTTAGERVPAATLGDLLARRATDRGVAIHLDSTVDSARARSFTIDGRVIDADAVVLATDPWEIDRLVGRRPPRWRPLIRGEDGPVWRHPSDWMRRPATRDPSGVFTASTHGRGGSEAWARLLGGALAAYAVHARLTGEDIRPVTKNRRR